jgi:ribose 5-phosphate isomerase B
MSAERDDGGVRMRVALGSDHAGFALKARLLERLAGRAEMVDVGTDGEHPVDYPDFAEAVALQVRDGRVDRGVVICGSGVGASVAANKIPGIRAGLCHDAYSAHQGVEHDDMNVLVLGSRVIGEELAVELVEAFLAAAFSGAERHRRRLAKVAALERRYGGGGE